MALRSSSSPEIQQHSDGRLHGPSWLSSHLVLTERAACLPRQASLLRPDHGKTLAIVERIGNDIEGLGRCASCQLDPHKAAHGSLRNLRLPARLTWRCLARVAELLGTSIAAIESCNRGRYDVATLIAAHRLSR